MTKKPETRDERRLRNAKRGGWVGVDLDGTLVQWNPGHGFDHESIGKPIPKMVNRVRQWLSQGITVKIFTARATEPKAKHWVEKWTIDTFGQQLEVTATKDYLMIELWDDRAVQVEQNTGEAIEEILETITENFT